MSSKCCDCETEWKMEYYYIDFYLNAIPPARLNPSYDSVRGSYPGCTVFDGSAPDSGSSSSRTIATYVPLKRVLLSGPSSNCDCVNSNGGSGKKINFEYVDSKILGRRTRVRNFNLSVTCPGSILFPGYTLYQVPVNHQQDFEFEAQIFRETYEYKKSHKCGASCQGDPTITPEPFNYEAETLNALTQIALNYNFN